MAKSGPIMRIAWCEISRPADERSRAIYFEAYSPSRQSQVTALADQVFGAGFFPNPGEIAQEPDTRFVLCLSDDGEELIGFIFGRLLPPEGLRDFFEGRVESIPKDIAEADAKGVLAVIRTIAVAPGQQGKGVGTKLLEIIHDSLVGLGGDTLMVTFKRDPGSPGVDKLMHKLGFELWAESGTYLRQRCDQGQFKCVARTDRCNCKALFYRKPVF